MAWRLNQTQQCAKCPWRKDVNARDIPNGYSVKKHKALKSTIAEPGQLSGQCGIRAMACHETHESECIGWLVNQVGRGNNIALRLKMMSCENARDIRLCGDQHEKFEETLPK